MRTVLVIDDEILVRIGIRSLLDWEGHGYSIVGEAADGGEALELAVRLEPDVILTDLVMPGTDGLELIRKLRERGNTAAVIVLSCHNDFDRVREAMRLGACDYLFKPTLKQEELLTAFDRCLTDRPQRSGRAPAAADTVLSRAVQPAAAGNAEHRGPERNREAFDHPYRIIAARFDASDGDVGTELLGQFARELARSYDQMLDTAACRRTAYFAVRNDGRTGLVDTFRRIEEFAGRYLGCMPTGGISPFARGAETVPVLLEEASRSADRCFSCGRSPVFSEEPETAVLPRPEDLAAACAAVRQAVLLGDGDAITEAASTVFSLVRAGAGAAPERLRRFTADAFTPFKDRARALGFELEDIDGGVTPDGIIAGARTIAAVEAWFPRFLTVFLAEASRRSGMRPEIAGVRCWVLQNLRRSFSVEEAAERARMSASHFAHVFRRETGWSFIEFVNRSRMERARELLLSTDRRVYEIASEVGFENSNYFSSLYRKLMGASPQETREERTRTT